MFAIHRPLRPIAAPAQPQQPSPAKPARKEAGQADGRLSQVHQKINVGASDYLDPAQGRWVYHP